MAAVGSLRLEANERQEARTMQTKSSFPALTTKQAGGRLGVSQAAVRAMIGRGELWGVKMSGWCWVDAKQVDALAAARRTA